jgi:hypothetical protein
VKYDKPISIFCDNTNAISISKNLVMHYKTKHIPIKYHFLWEHAIEKKIKLEYVKTKEQIADIFTKPLARENFEYLRKKLGVVSIGQLRGGVNQLLSCLNNYASFKIFTRHSMMITIMQGNKQRHIQHQSHI